MEKFIETYVPVIAGLLSAFIFGSVYPDIIKSIYGNPFAHMTLNFVIYVASISNITALSVLCIAIENQELPFIAAVQHTKSYGVIKRYVRYDFISNIFLFIFGVIYMVPHVRDLIGTFGLLFYISLFLYCSVSLCRSAYLCGIILKTKKETSRGC